MIHFSKLLILLATALSLASCRHTPTDAIQTDALPTIWPDYIGVTIPVGLAPLNFAMADEEVTAIDVVVTGQQGGQLHTQGEDTDFDLNEWHELLNRNKASTLTLSVCACRNGQWTRYRDFQIYVSNDSLDAWGITYRLIPPSYELYSGMALYQRNLSTFDETVLLSNTQVPGMCINCHTPNRTHPDQYVYHVRGAHGATVIHHHGKEELLKARNDSLGGSMVYPYWHPQGRYCAFSTNSTAQLFHTAKLKRIEVYDSKSDVFVYDTETHQLLTDTLTMTEGWSENTPAFSPDGKWLYFTTARQQNYPTDYDKQRYSLCRVAFDEKTGQLGQQVDTLVNARLTGKSVTWPRPSYDGRYVMYTQLDYGYFSVWHPEADLWLLDLQTGVSRPMDEVNSARSESLHNWTRGSRWFLFTSRRDNGLYTRIYLSSINADGKATKPFLLPQRHPMTYYGRLMYSYNTPDFTNMPVDLHARQTGIRIESDERVATRVLRER